MPTPSESGTFYVRRIFTKLLSNIESSTQIHHIRGECTAITVTGLPSNHSEWFALYRDDGKIDDLTWINGVARGQFRLHPAGGRGISPGCITLPSLVDFERIRQALLHTPTITAGNSRIRAYGNIEVITYGSTCP